MRVTPRPRRRRYLSAPIAAVSAAVIDAGRVLLVQRQLPPWAGAWSLPGGAVELGETALAAAAREVFEETGILPVVDEPIAVLDPMLRDDNHRLEYHYVLIVYAAHLRPGSRQSKPPGKPATDASAIRWVTADELEHLRLTPRLKSLLLPLLV